MQKSLKVFRLTGSFRICSTAAQNESRRSCQDRHSEKGLLAGRFSAAAAAILTGQAAAGGRHFAGVKLAPGEQRISECRVYFAPGEQQRASELQGNFHSVKARAPLGWQVFITRRCPNTKPHSKCSRYLPRYPRANLLPTRASPDTDTVSRVDCQVATVDSQNMVIRNTRPAGHTLYCSKVYSTHPSAQQRQHTR